MWPDAPPHNVEVGRGEHDVGGIGPVVVQAFPNAARAFRDIGLRAAEMMHLQIIVGAVAEEFRAARPEVGESGSVLLGRQRRCLMEVNLFFASLSFSFRRTLSQGNNAAGSPSGS